MEAVTTLITTLQNNLTTLIVPVAVCGVILWFLANAAKPLIPDWADGLRGYFQKLMLYVAVAGGATTLVTALYGLFGKTAGN